VHMKVVVIGAGTAGLAAASRLSREPGLEVTILEAKDRIGGRIKTGHLQTNSVGLGASWMHETRHNPLFQIGLKQGWSMRYTDLHPSFCTSRGEVPAGSGIGPILEDLNSILVEKYQDEPVVADEEPSMAEFSYKEINSMPLITARQRELARLAIREFEHFIAMPLGEFPVRDGAFPNVQGRDAYILGDGYQCVLDWLHSQINWDRVSLHLATPVTKVEESIVHTRTARFEADYVLCTIPIGALKHDFDTIFPALPDLAGVRETVKATSTGKLGKIIIEFESIFWNPDHDSFFVAHEVGDDIVTVINPSGSNMLMLLTGPPLTEKVESDPENAIKHIYWALQTIALPGKAVTKVNDYQVTNWTQDPYFRCSYSARSLGQSYDDLVAGYLYNESNIRFAGEHTILEGNGCVHGAYESGLREACIILKKNQ